MPVCILTPTPVEIKRKNFARSKDIAKYVEIRIKLHVNIYIRVESLILCHCSLYTTLICIRLYKPIIYKT